MPHKFAKLQPNLGKKFDNTYGETALLVTCCVQEDDIPVAENGHNSNSGSLVKESWWHVDWFF